MSSEIINNKLYIQITELLRLARQSVVRAVNQTMVCAYYDIGKIIIEDEQRGKQRADYGKHVLEELSKKLTVYFWKCFSVVSLRQMRSFFITYSIQQKTSAELPRPQFKLPVLHL